MITKLALIMIGLLLTGIPMMVPLLMATFYGFYELFNGFSQMDFMVQQMLAGIRPTSLTAVPMLFWRLKL